MEVKIHCKYDGLLDPKTLRDHPKNANKHDTNQVNRLAELYDYHGIRHPIIISKLSGYIVAGHCRKRSALKKGLKEFPVVYQDFENEDAEYAFLQADNAIALWAELDLSLINSQIIDLDPSFNIDMLGIKDFEIEPADKYQDKDDDAIPDVVEPKAKLGQIYKLGEHRLMCGSSVDPIQVARLLDGEIDMVYTDPPYGVNVVKGGMVGANFGVAKKGDYKEVINDETIDCAKEFYNTCKLLSLKNFIIWGGNYFTDFLEPKNSWVVWNKRSDSGIVNTFADAELAWSDIGFPARVHNQLWNGMIREGEKEKRVHPTQKPIALSEFCFDLLKDCKTVYDGFGGSGSTLIACEKTNRKCFMMELDPHYVDVIIARFEKYSDKKAELIHES